jgi:RimJ/RimL family protein N-acetyltransferase
MTQFPPSSGRGPSDRVGTRYPLPLLEPLPAEPAQQETHLAPIGARALTKAWWWAPGASRGRSHDVAVAVLLSDDVVVLRPLTPDDVDEWMSGEDTEQIHWFEFPEPAPRPNVERAISDWVQSWRVGGPIRHWAICDQTTSAIVGGVELRDAGDGDVNLSYVVFPAWRQRGVATRACRLALAYAASAMNGRVAVIRVLQGNAASIAVARKLGATVTGVEVTEAGNLSIVLRLDLESAATGP